MAWKAAIVGYGALAYGTSLVVFGYLMLFLVGVGVPKGIDDGPAGPVWAAVSVDVAPLVLFAVQHSVMARRWFKRWWTRFIAPPIERSNYVLASSATLALWPGVAAHTCARLVGRDPVGTDGAVGRPRLRLGACSCSAPSCSDTSSSSDCRRSCDGRGTERC